MAGSVVPLVAAARPAGAADAVVSYPVTFTVVNTDQTLVGQLHPVTSQLPLATGDGKTYQVQGHITAPAGAFTVAKPSAALYVAGLGYGEWFWHLTQVPAYDYAANQAAAGLTSVTIDNIGYVSGGTPGGPAGTEVGYGTEATVDHQILQDLYSGSYTMTGHAPVRFSRLALVGGTQAAFSAELETSTFHDAQGLVDAGFADEGFSSTLLTGYAANVATCEEEETGLAPTVPGYPADYAYREVGTTAFNDDDLGAATGDTSSQVTQVADALHAADPCGYPAYSVGPTLFENNLEDPLETTPILSVMGADDSEFDSPTPVSVALTYQKSVEFALNRDVTTVELPGAPQALTLGTAAPAFDTTMRSWLCARDFGAFGGSCSASVATATGTAPTGAGASAPTGATVAAAGASVPGATPGASLPVTGGDTPRDLAVGATLALLGVTVVGLSGVRTARRRR